MSGGAHSPTSGSTTSAVPEVLPGPAPPRPVPAHPVLALDIGGTKIAGALVDHSGALLCRARRPMPSGDAENCWQQLVGLIEELLPNGRGAGSAATGPPAAVAVGCAGPLDTRTGTVSPINIPSWQGFPLAQRLRELLPGREVTLAVDVVCLALGEHWLGAGTGSDHLLGMVVSTGVGGGLVLGGAAAGGRTGNAGHVGHVVVEPDGYPCSCGGRGCVETVAAGPHLVRWARERGWQAPAEADAEQLADAARRGEEIALAAFRRAGWAIGLGAVATAAVCDLDLVVLGGGVARAGELVLAPAREAIAEHAGLSFLSHLQVVPARLGDAAGLIGAAALTLRDPGRHPVRR